MAPPTQVQSRPLWDLTVVPAEWSLGTVLAPDVPGKLGPSCFPEVPVTPTYSAASDKLRMSWSRGWCSLTARPTNSCAASLRPGAPPRRSAGASTRRQRRARHRRRSKPSWRRPEGPGGPRSSRPDSQQSRRPRRRSSWRPGRSVVS